MSLRSAFITAAALLVLSAPAWGDSVKCKPAGSYDNVQFWAGSSQFDHFDIKFLGGFKASDPKIKESFTFKDGHFVLSLPLGWNGGHNSDSSAGTGSGAGKVPVGTPEPASSTLLLVGLIGVGAFIYRRNSSLLSRAS